MRRAERRENMGRRRQRPTMDENGLTRRMIFPDNDRRESNYSFPAAVEDRDVGLLGVSDVDGRVGNGD